MTNATDAISDRIRVVVVVVVVLMAGVGGVVAGSDRVSSSRSVVESASSGPLTLETAPLSTFDELLSVDQINERATNERDAAIASGDVLILNFTDPKLQSAMRNGTMNGTEPTARDLLSSDQFDLLVRQTDAESNPKQLNLSAGIHNGTTRLITGEQRTYLLIDTRGALFDTGGKTVAAEPTESFEASVTWNTDGKMHNATESFEITPRTATFDTQDEEKVVVSASKHQRISGSTTLAPGSKLRVRARSTGPSAFIITKTTRVNADGDFSLEFDFSNVGGNVSFELNVMNPGIESPANGFITQSPTATVVVENQVFESTENQTVFIQNSRLDKGGFVTIHDKSYLNDNISYNESLRGVKKVTKNQTSVRIPLDKPYRKNGTLIVVPHFDTNDNGEFEYRSNNGTVDRPYLGPDKEPIVTSASVRIEQPTSASSKENTDFSASSKSNQKGANGATNKEAKASKNANGKTNAGGGTSGDGTTGGSGWGSLLPVVVVIGGGLLLGFLIAVLVLRWKR